MEMPAVRFAVLRFHIVKTVPVVEADESDALDEKTGTEPGTAFEIERIEETLIQPDVAGFREAEDVQRHRIQRDREAQLRDVVRIIV